MSNFTDNILAQYKVSVTGDKELLRFLDAADKKAARLQATLSKLGVRMGSIGGVGGVGRGYGYGIGGGRGGATIPTSLNGLLGRSAAGAGGLFSVAGSMRGLGFDRAFDALKFNLAAGNANVFKGMYEGVGELSSLVGPARALGAALGAVTAVAVGLSIELAKLSIDVSKKGGKLESMERRLGAVAVGLDASPWERMQAGRLQLQEMYQIAKLPGINLDDSSRSYSQLKVYGLSDEKISGLLKGLGNFNALMGQGKADFDGILMALQDIVTKGKLDSTDIRQFSEHGIPLRRIMQDRWGVSEGKDFMAAGHTVQELLDGIIDWMGKVPRAADGAENAWENVEQAIERATGSLGMGANGGGFTDAVRAFTDAVDHAVESGALEALGEQLAAIAAIDASDIEGKINSAIDWAPQSAGGFKGFLEGVATLISPAGGAFKEIFEAVFGEDAEKNRQNREALEGYKKALDEQRKKRKKSSVARAPEEDAAEQFLDSVTKPIEERNRNRYDLRRIMFGGDDLARYGVTPTELGAGAAQNTRFTIDVSGTEGNLVSFVTKIASQLVSELDRSGWLRPPRG